jgi:hypothetical protein
MRNVFLIRGSEKYPDKLDVDARRRRPALALFHGITAIMPPLTAGSPGAFTFRRQPDASRHRADKIIGFYRFCFHSHSLL